MLDEVQEVEEWEKSVNFFTMDFDVHVYLTGSNSHLLSSELATYLAGRYVEIPVLILSYKEFLDFRKQYRKIAKFAFFASFAISGNVGEASFHTCNGLARLKGV